MEPIIEITVAKTVNIIKTKPTAKNNSDFIILLYSLIIF